MIIWISIKLGLISLHLTFRRTITDLLEIVKHYPSTCTCLYFTTVISFVHIEINYAALYLILLAQESVINHVINYATKRAMCNSKFIYNIIYIKGIRCYSKCSRHCNICNIYRPVPFLVILKRLIFH